MAAAEITPVILNLVSIDDSPLRGVCCRSVREKRWITKQDSSHSGVNIALIGYRITDRIAAKLHPDAAIRCAKFVAHAARERPGPTERVILRERRNVDRVARSGGNEAICVVECRSIV